MSAHAFSSAFSSAFNIESGRNVTLRIARLNYVDAAIVTAAHAISSLPAANLKEEDIQKIWRDTSNANTNLTADLGAQVEIGMTALINTNLISTDGVRIRVSSADPTGAAGDVYDQGGITPDVDPVYGNFIYFIEPSVTGRYVRIDLFDLTNTPEAGRWVIAPTWTPSRHFSFGWEMLWRDASRRTYSLGQNIFTDVQQRQRGFRFVLRGLTEDEAMDEVSELNRVRGIGRDILVCRNAESTNLGRDSIWGLLEEPARMRHMARTGGAADIWEVEFEVWARL